MEDIFDPEHLPTDKTPDFILSIDLIPRNEWWWETKQKIPKCAWDKIRRDTLVKYKNKCAICKNKNKFLYLHENWHYDYHTKLQTLAGFVMLCEYCYHIKHIAFTKQIAFDGKLRYHNLVEHFMKINDCTYKEFIDYRDDIYNKWLKDSKKKWKIRFGNYDYLLNMANNYKNPNPNLIKKAQEKAQEFERKHGPHWTSLKPMRGRDY